MRFEDSEYEAVKAAYFDRSRAMSAAVEKAAGNHIRDFFPTATKFRVLGDSEGPEFTNRLRIQAVLGPDDEVLADYDDHHTDEFDELADLIDPYLDWLIELDPDDWFNSHDIDIEPEVASDGQ